MTSTRRGAGMAGVRTWEPRRGPSVPRSSAGSESSAPSSPACSKRPCTGCESTDPNWAFDRIAEIERAHGGRSTYFVMTGPLRTPADGPAPAAYDPPTPGDRDPDRRPGRRDRAAPELCDQRAAAAAGRGEGAAGGAHRRAHRRSAVPLPATPHPRDAAASWTSSGFATTPARALPRRRDCGPASRCPYRRTTGRRPAARSGRAAAGDHGRHPGRAALPGPGRRCRPAAGGARARAGGGRPGHRGSAVARRPLRPGVRSRLGPRLRAAAAVGGRSGAGGW